MNTATVSNKYSRPTAYLNDFLRVSKKIVPSCGGPLFVGPCSAKNKLNMPKYALVLALQRSRPICGLCWSVGWDGHRQCWRRARYLGLTGQWTDDEASARPLLFASTNSGDCSSFKTKSAREPWSSCVTSVILSRNVILAGLPASTIAPLQLVQNAGARSCSTTRPSVTHHIISPWAPQVTGQVPYPVQCRPGVHAPSHRSTMSVVRWRLRRLLHAVPTATTSAFSRRPTAGCGSSVTRRHVAPCWTGVKEPSLRKL